MILYGCKLLYSSMISKKERIKMHETSIKENQKLAKLCLGKWAKEENLTIVKQMQEWAVVQLTLWGNQRQQLVKQISHVRFTKLKLLNLGRNKITSIEGLTRVFMPHLQILSIHQNKIISVMDITKAYWPELLNFDINQNFILKEDLAKASLSKLQWVLMDDWKDSSPSQLQDLRFLVKLGVHSLKYLGINESRSSIQPKIHDTLSRKWPSIEIDNI